MKNEIEIETAKMVIELFPTEDEYISSNIQRFMNENNEPDDNSIELAYFYQKCRKILNDFHVPKDN